MLQCSSCSRGAELRQKLHDAKKISGREIDSSKRLKVNLGAGQVKEYSLRDLEERERQSPEWRAVSAGGLRIIPIREFRLNSLPKPKNGAVEFQTSRRNEGVIDGYPMHITVESIERELQEEFNALRVKEFSENDAAKETIRKLKKKHEAVQKWKDTNAEITAKLAFEKLLKHIGAPSLLVRSVEHKDFNMRLNTKALNAIGLHLPTKAGETDLLLAYVSGKHLHVVLCEVKRPRTEPWASQEKEPSKESIKKAVDQLIAGT